MMNYEDVVHGPLVLPNHVAQIIQTPQFLRLKKIKQLGFLYTTHPKAINTRYEHSIGTYWLAKRMLDGLEKNSSWLKLDKDFEFYRSAVEIAALLHDIGHGPFSHTWESISENFNHEENARECVLAIFSNLSASKSDTTVIGQLLQNDNYGVELIIALIMGSKDLFPFEFPAKFNFIFEIVHNRKCQVDVDKWDYLLRDRYYVQDLINPDIKFETVFTEARAAPDGSCIEYRYSDYYKIYEIFFVRWAFHNSAYHRPIQMAVEKLLKSLVERNPHWQIGNVPLRKINSKTMDAFLELTDDNLLKLVEEDPGHKFLKDSNLFTPIPYWQYIENNEYYIKVVDELKSAEMEMPGETAFSFYGDEKTKSTIPRDYRKTIKYYYFKVQTDNNNI